MRRLPADRMLDRMIAARTAHRGRRAPRGRQACGVLSRVRADPDPGRNVSAAVRRGDRREPARAHASRLRPLGQRRGRRVRSPAGCARPPRGDPRRARARRPHRRGARRPASRARVHRGRAAGHRLPRVLARPAVPRSRRRTRVPHARVRAACGRLGPRARIRRLRGSDRDAPPPALVAFYQSYRAAVRAKIAAWHLNDDGVRAPATWTDRATGYLALARAKLAACG